MQLSHALTALLASYLNAAANAHIDSTFEQAIVYRDTSHGEIGLNPINKLPVAPEGRPNAGKLALSNEERKHAGRKPHHPHLGHKHGGHRHHKHKGHQPGPSPSSESSSLQVTSSTPVAPVSTPATSPAPTPTPTPNPPADEDVHTGDATYYTPGLGSCGITNTESDAIVALAADMMTGSANPNDNPNCGRSITITYGGKTVQATIEDTCPGCTGAWLDLTPSLFSQLADLAEGRLSGVQWSFD